MNLGLETARPDGGGCRIALTGEVDLDTAPLFERELRKAIESGGQSIVIDLTATTFVDSTFLGVLIRAQNQLDGPGGRISIECSDTYIPRIFEVTGLDRLFAIRTSADGGSPDGTARPE